MSGYLAAAIAVLIWASYPVATRAGVTGSFTPGDLVTLRFGVGALLFLPYLLLHWRQIRPSAWLQGVPLMVFQGAGMAALVIWGLQLAPARHQAALGPGVVSAWVALLGLLIFARKPSTRLVAGALFCASGVLLIAWSGASERNMAVLAGDAMFLAASALGALYVLQLRSWGVSAFQAAAIVTVYSAMLVVPWHLCSAPEPLWRAAPLELCWQILWQGVLIGCVAFIALNHAIAKLGSERSSAMIALVPLLTAGLALIFLGEVPSPVEIVAFIAISTGVSIGAAPGKPAPSPAIRLPAALPRSARPVGYRARDSAP